MYSYRTPEMHIDFPRGIYSQIALNGLESRNIASKYIFSNVYLPENKPVVKGKFLLPHFVFHNCPSPVLQKTNKTPTSYHFHILVWFIAPSVEKLLGR